MMHIERRWVIRTLAVIGVGLVLYLGGVMLRLAFRPGLQAGARETLRITSQKDLMAALKDPATRDEAVGTLRRTKDVEAIPLLSDLSHKSSDPDVRSACLTVLGDWGDLQGVHPLTVGVRDPETQVRIAAVRALGKIRTREACEAIGLGLTDVDVSVREAAALTLAAADIDDGAAPALINALATEERVAVRRAIMQALGRTVADAARSALLVALQKEADPSVRAAAADSLLAHDDAWRVKGAACALGDAEEAVRAKGEGFLRELRGADLADLEDAIRAQPLRGVLFGPRGKTACDRIAEALAMMTSPDSAGALIELMDVAVGVQERVRYPEVIERVTSELAGIGQPVVKPLASAALKHDARLGLKRAVAAVFARLGASAVAPIRDYIESRKMLPSSEEARLWAETLLVIGGPDALAAAAMAKARDPEEVFRKQAAGLPPMSTERLPAPQRREFALVLHGGIYPGNPPSAYARRSSNLPFVKEQQEAPDVEKFDPKGRASLMLDLTRLEKGWDRVVGHSGSYFNTVTFGRLDRIEVSDAAIEAALRVDVARDIYMMGGYGEYTVSLKRLADGTYRGAYQGRFRDIPVQGVATCAEKPKRPPLRAGFRPVEPNEHPRVLFRKDDLPRLRAKISTPLGRVFYRMLAGTPDGGPGSGYTVAMGMLYQLTGDERYALQIIPAVRKEMAERDMEGAGGFAGRFANIARAFDLCYDAWPPEFRAEVDKYMRTGSYVMATAMGKLHYKANTHPCSNYFAPMMAGGGMLSLAYWMDPGPPPGPPAGMRVFEPPLLKDRPAGAPVVSLSAFGQAFEQCLWSGPLYEAVLPEDLIAAVGDVAANPVREGRSFAFGKGQHTFHPAPDGIRNREGLYPWGFIADEKPDYSTVGMLLYSVIENAKPAYYRVLLPGQGESLCSINGVRVASGSVVRLEAGPYPVLMALTGGTNMMTTVGAQFRFLTANRAEMDVLLAEGAEKTKSEQLLYELNLADHRATGMDSAKNHVFQMGKVHVYRNNRLMMGSGGFQSEGEGYTGSAQMPLEYAAAYWNVFGQVVSPYPDITHFAARYVAAGTLAETGGGRRVLWAQSFNGGHDATLHGINFIAPSFPYIPEEYQPAVLWVWNRLAGVEEDKPETLARLVEGQGFNRALYAFLHYPLDPATGETSVRPVHPERSFPKTWRATDKGLHVFRNAWQDDRDIVVQVYANQLMSKGWGHPDSGAIRIRGFGHDWTPSSPGKKTSYRWLECVPILMPDKEIKRASGVVTSWNGEPDGSGHVSINLDMVYTHNPQGRHDSVGIWPPDPPAPGEVRGLRSVAVDYSGKCGAPALIVLVDKIEGGGERKWLWHLRQDQPTTLRGADVGTPLDASRKDDDDEPVDTGAVPASAEPSDAQVRADKNGFTIRQGKATLRAVFVSPGDLKVEAPGIINVSHDDHHDPHNDKHKMTWLKDKTFRPPPEPTRVTVAATAPSGTSFFVVMTLQEGPAPEVIVEKKEGLETVVCVGRQRVRFDGENVLIEDL